MHIITSNLDQNIIQKLIQQIQSQMKNGSTEAACSLDVIEIEPYCIQSYLSWVKISFNIYIDYQVKGKIKNRSIDQKIDALARES